MRPIQFYLFLVLAYISTTGIVSGQTTLQIINALNTKIQAIERGAYDVHIQFKSAPIEDTATFSGRVYFFKNPADPHGLAHFILLGRGKLSSAYDGNFFYNFDHKEKMIRITAPGEHNPVELMKGGLFRELSLFRPYLKATGPAFSPEQFEGYTLDTNPASSAETVRLNYELSYPNDFKLSPIDPDTGRHIIHYEISLPDYSLRSISEWQYFMQTPQYQRIEFSPIRPLPEDSTLNGVVGWVNLFQSGFRIEYYDPNADVEMQEIKSLAEGDIFPAFALPDLDGATVRSENLTEGILLIDFWYRACAPCLKAMPSIENLHQRYGEKGLTILGVNPFDKDADKLKTFMETRGFNYRVLLDREGRLPEQVGIDSYPTLLLVDAASKKILYVQAGFGEGSEGELEKVIIHQLRE